MRITSRNLTVPEDQAFEVRLVDDVYIEIDLQKAESEWHDEAKQYLSVLHGRIPLAHGNWWDELPEQVLIARYLTHEARVLEIGANVGRSTIVAASRLRNPSTQLVTLECDPLNVKMLEANRKASGYPFVIEPCALSAVPLVQKGWNTRPGSLQPEEIKKEEADGWKSVPVVSWSELSAKYPSGFDTLIADCEGALYHIVGATPQILNGLRLVVVENDYLVKSQKLEVDIAFRKAGLRLLYHQVGPSSLPCNSQFYEVWVRD